MESEAITRKYIRVQAMASDARTPENERKAAQAILRKMEEKYPGIKEAAAHAQKKEQQPERAAAEEARAAWDDFVRTQTADPGPTGGLFGYARRIFLSRADEVLSEDNIEAFLSNLDLEQLLEALGGLGADDAEELADEDVEDEDTAPEHDLTVDAEDTPHGVRMVLHFTDDGIEEYLYTKRGRKELIEALKAAAE